MFSKIINISMITIIFSFSMIFLSAESKAEKPKDLFTKEEIAEVHGNFFSSIWLTFKYIFLFFLDNISIVIPLLALMHVLIYGYKCRKKECDVFFTSVKNIIIVWLALLIIISIFRYFFR